MSCGKMIEGYCSGDWVCDIVVLLFCWYSLLLLIFANFCLLFLFFYVLCVGVGYCYLCVCFLCVFFLFFFLVFFSFFFSFFWGEGGSEGDRWCPNRKLRGQYYPE